ncbi:LLM class flavin-dependent oxidoreductase [Chitinophagaceae bacterium MMS25-I14]
MKLSILDQSPIRKGSNAHEALQETTALAQFADKAGYTRFWVSEHHNTQALAGTSPEVLIAHLAANTKRIRIGSGGVMLPHYSSLKVAENFRLLETLYPNRIDLGMGRAPGGDRLTAAVLNPANSFSEDNFVQQLADLQAYLSGSSEAGTIHEKIKAMPDATTVPEQWILSSSGQSGYFAAHFGMGFSFAHFINPDGGPQAVKMYKNRFQPSEYLHKPEANMAIFVYCSEDEEQIRQQQAISDYRFYQLETKGRLDPVDYNDVKDMAYSDTEQQRILYNRRRTVIGKPDFVKARLEALAEEYGVDEIIAANITQSFQERIRSYELLAEMFSIKG